MDPRRRIRAIDRMRGIVMVLMASDHASSAFNAHRPADDSALDSLATAPLDTIQFLVRWASHLCAPTFAFLAGASIALRVASQRDRGVDGASIDRDLVVRGLVVASVDVLVINWMWDPGTFLLGVMFALGMSMIAMVGIRRLPAVAIAGLIASTVVLGEVLRPSTLSTPLRPGDIGRAVLLSGGRLDVRVFHMTAIEILYPVAPWCALVALGWLFGQRLHRSPLAARRALLVGAGAGFVTFAVLRGVNQFGNLGLYRTSGSVVQWLHTSKYPPSLTFASLELALMAAILFALFALDDREHDRAGDRGPLMVFGQTPFFFYVTHIVLLEVAARRLGMYEQRGLHQAAVATVLVLIVMYPCCRWYRSVKRSTPRSVLRFF